MCAQIDELPDSQDTPAKNGGNLLPVLLALILAPAISAGATYFIIGALKPEETEKPIITEGGQPLDIEPSGDEKLYDVKDLITNLGGPVRLDILTSSLKWKVWRETLRRFSSKMNTGSGTRLFPYSEATLTKMPNWMDLRSGFELILKKVFPAFCESIVMGRAISFVRFTLRNLLFNNIGS